MNKTNEAPVSKMHTSSSNINNQSYPGERNSLNDQNELEGIGLTWSRSESVSTISDIGNWLISVPRDDVRALQNTVEYHNFLKAFECLGHAHRRTILNNRAAQARIFSSLSAKDSDIQYSSNTNSIQVNNTRSKKSIKLLSDESPHMKIKNKKNNDDINMFNDPISTYSFLQHLAVDDVILRVFEFLECAALVRTSRTCHRFRDLALRSSMQRTRKLEYASVLDNPMKLLRAKEQMDGVAPYHGPFVRVPILSLPRRIQVTRSGDREYNGIYFCTGCNGNGYLFAKPRTIRSQSRRVLNCIIGKRFSNETILWYMSKEDSFENSSVSSNANNTNIHHNNHIQHNHNNSESEVSQTFSFWAKLMVIGEAAPDICRYPSQTSILARNGQSAWQSLPNTISVTPPVVELLD